MTVFGHPVLFDLHKNSENTASEKTPMQWHIYEAFELANVFALIAKL